MFTHRHPFRASDDAAVQGSEEAIRAGLKDVEYEVHMDRLRRENVALVCREAALDEILKKNESMMQQVVGEFQGEKLARDDMEKDVYANDAERLAAAGAQIDELKVKRDELMKELAMLRST